MDLVAYAVKFLTIEEGDVDTSVYQVIEDCGEHSELLSGVKLCFSHERVDELAEYLGSTGESKTHFLENYRKNPKHMVSYPSFLENMSFTEGLLKYYESPENVFNAFGLSWLRTPDTEEKDDILISDEVIDGEESNESELGGNLTTIDNELEEEEIVNPEEGNLTNEDTEEELSKVIPRLSSEKSYTSMEVLEVVEVFNKTGVNIPRVKSDLERLVIALTGRKNPTGFHELTDAEFNSCMEFLQNLSPSDFKRAVQVVFRRFWRFGEVEVMSRIMDEIIHYYQETGDRNS